MTDTAIAQLVPTLGVREACQAVGAAQASYYREPPKLPTDSWINPPDPPEEAAQ